MPWRLCWRTRYVARLAASRTCSADRTALSLRLPATSDTCCFCCCHSAAARLPTCCPISLAVSVRSSVVPLSAFDPVSVRDEVSVVDVLVVPLLGRVYCWVAVGDAVLGSVTPPNPVGSPYMAAELLPVSVWVTVTFDGVGVPVACGPVSRIFSADGWFDSVVAAEAASGLSRPAVLNYHEHTGNKIAYYRTRKDSNFKPSSVFATMF